VSSIGDILMAIGLFAAHRGIVRHDWQWREKLKKQSQYVKH